MKRTIYIFLILFISLFNYSCNPQMHIVGYGMRHHNLSQNKYQPKKQRKQIKVGASPFSPVWFLLRRY